MMENNNEWNNKVTSSLEEMAAQMEKEVATFRTEEEIKEEMTSLHEKSIPVQPVVEEEPVVKKETIIESKVEVEREIPKTVEEPKNTVQPQNKTPNPREFLDNLTFDVTNIRMVEKTPLKDIQNFEFVLNNKSKTQIVANQSNYIAYMESLTYNEIAALTNSTLDDYSAQLLLAQTIYSKINTTTVGKMKFDEWTNITSFYDIDNFLYGIYLETFPGDTKFSITCGNCQEKIDAVINNDTLISSKNDGSTINVQQILNNKNSREELLNSSLVNHKERIVLPNSKIIMDIKIPTIKKHLDILGSINKNSKEKTQHILSIMMFLDKVLMIDVEQSMKNNAPCYYEITEREKIARIISQLSFQDAQMVTKFINEFIDKHALVYKIKSFKCPKCQDDIGDITIDMETLLFFQILQM